MDNVAREQGLALQQLFSDESSYFLKTPDCHKISSIFNDGGLDTLLSISDICLVIANNIMQRKSHDGLAAKGLYAGKR